MTAHVLCTIQSYKCVKTNSSPTPSMNISFQTNLHHTEHTGAYLWCLWQSGMILKCILNYTTNIFLHSTLHFMIHDHSSHLQLEICILTKFSVECVTITLNTGLFTCLALSKIEWISSSCMSTFHVNFMFQVYIQQQNELVSDKHLP